MYLLNLDVLVWLVIKKAWMNRWTNILIKRDYTVIQVFLFKSLFFAALHLFKELWKSCLVIPLPCVLTLKSLSLILGFSLDLSLVTIKFWLLNTLSQLQVWSGKVSAYWANLIISGISSLWNRVIVFQRDGILSTGYFADLTIVFTKLRWKKQSTHVLNKISVHVMIAFWITQFFPSNLTQERDLKY